MYNNSAKGQLNKKARCQEGMKARALRAIQIGVNVYSKSMSLRGDFVPFRIMGMRINTGMSLRGVENPVAISFGNRNSHNALTFGVNVFPFHVIPSDPQVAWESSGFRQSRPNGVRERCPHKNSYETKVKSLILRSEMKEFELPIIQDSLLYQIG